MVIDVPGGSGLHGEDVFELLEFRVLIGHSREGQLTGERVLEFAGQWRATARAVWARDHRVNRLPFVEVPCR